MLLCVFLCAYTMCVCTSRYVIMYACMHECMYARLHVCVHAIMPAGACLCMQRCMPTCCSYTSIMFNRSDPHPSPHKVLSCFLAGKKQCHQATRQPSRDLRRGKSSPLVSCFVWLVSRFHLQTSGKDYPNS